jgi:hypothetical protein
MHGITKMQEYMKLFGSGINFYGGPGESAHKQIIKILGQRTQCRVSEFAQQTAFQYYNMIVSSNAVHDCQSYPIFTNSQEILAQILPVLKQKEKL